MKKYLLILGLALLAGCQNAEPKKNNVVEVTPNPKNSLDYIGTYKGVLPCLDCQSMHVEISINENSTFCIRTKYQGKGENVYVQKGNFRWNKEGTTIILTDVKNGPNQYLVGKNTLNQLSATGKKETGSLADEYILTKQSGTDTLNLETANDNPAATVDLNSRVAATTTIEKVNPAVGKYPLAETKWKLVSLNSEKADQKGKNAYYLKLKSKDGRFAALSGCNNILGYYVMPSSRTLTFSRVTSTKSDCADMALESKFFTALAETTRYSIDKETMTLYGASKKQLATFVVVK